MLRSLIVAASIALPPLVSEDVLEPSVQNEVDHALSLVPDEKVKPSVASAEFAKFYATNSLSATDKAIRLVSTQKDGRWYYLGTNVTPAAVSVLRRLSER